MKRKFKVKLAAIAKDECAYLPEWIYHHLEIGFDELEIYVNNTSDNTSSLAENLANMDSVKFIDADYLFNGDFPKPQEAAYQKAYERAIQDGFDYLMFLDIDEFWASKNPKDDVHALLNQLGEPDVVCLNWFLVHEDTPFSSLGESQIKGQTSRWVKTLFSLKLDIERIDVHCVKAIGAQYVFADGSPWNFEKYGKDSSVIPTHTFKQLDKKVMILHRMYRSELEYISLLYRGRPKKTGSQFKTNRKGFCELEGNLNVFKSSDQFWADRNKKFKHFIDSYKLESLIEKSREFVLKRGDAACKAIRESDESEYDILQTVLRGVNLLKVRQAHTFYKQKTKQVIRHRVLSTVRSLAISIDKIDPENANELMQLAHKLKPDGKLIISKLREYEKALDVNKSN